MRVYDLGSYTLGLPHSLRLIGPQKVIQKYLSLTLTGNLAGDTTVSRLVDQSWCYDPLPLHVFPMQRTCNMSNVCKYMYSQIPTLVTGFMTFLLLIKRKII